MVGITVTAVTEVRGESGRRATVHQEGSRAWRLVKYELPSILSLVGIQKPTVEVYPTKAAAVGLALIHCGATRVEATVAAKEEGAQS